MHAADTGVDTSLEAATLRDPRALQRLVTDQAAELRVLRQRLATLESALAAARVPVPLRQGRPVSLATPVTELDFARRGGPAQASEFAPAIVPAVAPVRIEAVISDEAAAQVWASPDVSFEERIAAKAFFGHGSVDEESRSWLLG